MSRVPMKATPLRPEQLPPFIERAFQQVFARQPTRNEAEWLTALVWAENAKGRAIIAHNWGNRSYSSRSTGLYWVPPWADAAIPNEELTQAELITRERLAAGKAVPTKFAAYTSHDEGARAYMRLFTTKTHRRILTAAARNDGVAFWRAISTPHPETRMVYCVECTSEAHRDLYQSFRDQIHAAGWFEGLPDPKAGGEGGPSRSSPPSGG